MSEATLGPGSLVDAVIEKTGYEALIDEEPSPSREDRLQNLKELRTAATDFEEREGLGLREFLDRTFLLADADSIRDDAPVLLMTLHAAKGLEFDTVFLVGMEEGLIPHMRAVQDPGQMEEERRLCYVGMTRARNRLVLTRARELLAASDDSRGQQTLRSAERTQSEAQTEYRAGHHEQSLRMTQSARAMAHRAMRSAAARPR